MNNTEDNDNNNDNDDDSDHSVVHLISKPDCRGDCFHGLYCSMDRINYEHEEQVVLDASIMIGDDDGGGRILPHSKDLRRHSDPHHDRQHPHQQYRHDHHKQQEGILQNGKHTTTVPAAAAAAGGGGDVIRPSYVVNTVPLSMTYNTDDEEDDDDDDDDDDQADANNGNTSTRFEIKINIENAPLPSHSSSTIKHQHPQITMDRPLHDSDDDEEEDEEEEDEDYQEEEEGEEDEQEEDEEDEEIEHEDIQETVPAQPSTYYYNEISSSPSSRNLMRQVSGLGMEDPVFGTKEDGPVHPSQIYDDMSVGDLPDDMKDIISIASDPTASLDDNDDGGGGLLDPSILQSTEFTINATSSSRTDMHIYVPCCNKEISTNNASISSSTAPSSSCTPFLSKAGGTAAGSASPIKQKNTIMNAVVSSSSTRSHPIHYSFPKYSTGNLQSWDPNNNHHHHQQQLQYPDNTSSGGGLPISSSLSSPPLDIINEEMKQISILSSPPLPIERRKEIHFLTPPTLSTTSTTTLSNQQEIKFSPGSKQPQENIPLSSPIEIPLSHLPIASTNTTSPSSLPILDDAFFNNNHHTSNYNNILSTSQRTLPAIGTIFPETTTAATPLSSSRNNGMVTSTSISSLEGTRRSSSSTTSTNTKTTLKIPNMLLSRRNKRLGHGVGPKQSSTKSSLW